MLILHHACYIRVSISFEFVIVLKLFVDRVSTVGVSSDGELIMFDRSVYQILTNVELRKDTRVHLDAFEEELLLPTDVVRSQPPCVWASVFGHQCSDISVLSSFPVGTLLQFRFILELGLSEV